MSSTGRPTRRSLFGAALAATGAGLMSRFGDAAAAPPVVQTLYLDRYATATGDKRGQRGRGDQTVLRGALRTAEGDDAGEIFASALTMPGPVTDGAPRTARMEIHNLQLRDGTLIAMGTTFAQEDVPNVYTVIGGTGRYATARGAYTFDDNPNVARPEGAATITFDLVGAPAGVR